jgi:hypothetical protein
VAQCAIHPGRSIVQRACGNGPVSKRAASVGGLFLFDLDFSVRPVGDLKSHHEHFEPVDPIIDWPA